MSAVEPDVLELGAAQIEFSCAAHPATRFHKCGQQPVLCGALPGAAHCVSLRGIKVPPVMEREVVVDLQDTIGYRFKNENLLRNALTHSSYANEKRGSGISSNERFEFLGDSVLGLIVAEYLYLRYPDLSEGDLTRMRASLVCEQNLAHAAGAIDLTRHLLLGKGESRNDGRSRSSIAADSVEAVIAALYLDGGYAVAQKFVKTFIIDGKGEKAKDYKTLLQELIQREPGHSISYEAVSESGPAHNRVYTVRVLIDGEPAGEGTGRSKKSAEQGAAREAFEKRRPD